MTSIKPPIGRFPEYNHRRTDCQITVISPQRLDVIRITVILGMAVMGCRRDDVAHFRVPKTAPAASGVSPAAMSGGADLPPPPATGAKLGWTLPKGWSENLSGGIRYATLKPATAGRIEVTVIVLPGPAGGELANVNRWRSQIGLAALEESALAPLRKRIATKAGPVAIYDFVSEGEAKSRVIAALASSEGNTWFVKMVGDAAPVGAARSDFIRLLESLRFDPAQ